MKRILSLLLPLLFLIMYSCNRGNEIQLQFSNPTDLDRVNEVVHISYDDFIILAGEIPADHLPVFLIGKDTLVSQNIDPDRNGMPDDILVEISLPAKASEIVRVRFTEAAGFPGFPEKTNLHFAFKGTPGSEIDTVSRVQTTDTQVTQKVFQLEGPVWENDKLGFRNYFDLRNGMDIFGKIVGGMVLDTIGLGGNYHAPGNWGMDVLKVANSLGAGSIGLDIGGKLFRIGDNGRGKFERLYEGPLRSEFRFDFDDWKADGRNIRITQYVSITAGKYNFASEVYMNGSEVPAGTAGVHDSTISLIAGIVNKLSNALYHEQVSPGHMLIATHDKQAEDSAYMGMGILVPQSQFIEYAEAPDQGEGITETYYARIRLMKNEPSVFYFYAGWETGNPEFAEMAAFIRMIKQDAIKMENPVIIRSVTRD